MFLKLYLKPRKMSSFVSNGKVSAYSAGDLGLIPGQEDPLEKGMTIHSSTLSRKIPWTEECSRLQSMGSQRVGHD